MGLRLGDRLQRLLAPLLIERTLYSLFLSSLIRGRVRCQVLGIWVPVGRDKIGSVMVAVSYKLKDSASRATCPVGISPKANRFGIAHSESPEVVPYPLFRPPFLYDLIIFYIGPPFVTRVVPIQENMISIRQRRPKIGRV